MVEPLLVVGVPVAVFVGCNIGGSSAGVAFGPAVGSRVLSKRPAAGLMTALALLGGWTVGRPGGVPRIGEEPQAQAEAITPAELFDPRARAG